MTSTTAIITIIALISLIVIIYLLPLIIITIIIITIIIMSLYLSPFLPPSLQARVPQCELMVQVARFSPSEL